MKEEIKSIVEKAVNKITGSETAEQDNFEIQIPKNKEFGDFSTNAALTLSGKLKLKPREIAEKLAAEITNQQNNIIEKVDIAGPGFINFYIREDSFTAKLADIYRLGADFGSSTQGSNEKVIVEFVSANPTGYLHFGHARNAVVGDTICRILSFSGFKVLKEFYINDAGRQMEMLGESVFARYLQAAGKNAELPEDGYQGEYVIDIANELKIKYDDSLISKNKAEAISLCTEFAYGILLEEIKKDLSELRVDFDNWYSERSNIHNVSDNSKLNNVKEKLNATDAVHQKDGALWFKATEYGDNQDWVLIKSDNSPTYFIADIAYHDDKYERGFSRLINIWGADHHSHFARLKASMKAMGHDDSKLEVVLIQFVRLIKDGKEVSMSKRSGTFVTLRDVLNEVGCDVTRFFLLMRSSDSHLDFDLNLASEQSNDNPVYYIQYAHARIMSILRNAEKDSLKLSDQHLDKLTDESEQDIIKKLLSFPEVVESSCKTLAPHKIVYYLQELASEFHTYYNKTKIINIDNRNLSSARIYLIVCIKIVISNGLNLLGVNAPQRM